ncbi:MAG: hypothetical protein WAM44_21170 [Chthoniobacterales bacterium]
MITQSAAQRIVPLINNASSTQHPGVCRSPNRTGFLNRNPIFVLY